MIDNRPKIWSHPLMIKNSIQKEGVHFEPQDSNNIRMYVCGPTPHGPAHIGNLRTSLSFDIIYRTLMFTYGKSNVQYVSNYTDIDDKIIRKSIDQKTTPEKIALKYIEKYENDLNSLNILPVTTRTKVTEYIPKIIKQIEVLISEGKAYEVEGNVFFDCSEKTILPLSGRKFENSESKREINSIDLKRSLKDFNLWKPDEIHGFDSPWGRGRPGWHQECVVMSQDVMGPYMDIHGGGNDLISPHHDCECILTSDLFEPVRHWVHSGMVVIKNENNTTSKMSKSLNNIVDMDSLSEYNPLHVRFALLQTHYQKPIKWSEENLTKTFKQFNKFLKVVDDYTKPTNLIDAELLQPLHDNFNLPQVFTNMAKDYKEGNWRKVASMMNLIGIKSKVTQNNEDEKEIDTPLIS